MNDDRLITFGVMNGTSKSGRPRRRDTKACPPTPSRRFSLHLEQRWGMDVQTRRDISRTVDDRG